MQVSARHVCQDRRRAPGIDGANATYPGPAPCFTAIHLGKYRDAPPNTTQAGPLRLKCWPGWMAVFQNGRRKCHPLYVRRLRFLMSLRFPSLALGSVPVLARRLSVFGVATVNRKFWPNSKSSGLGAFPAARHFPFAARGRGFKPFARTTAFPANPSNTAVKAAPFGRWTLRDKAPRSAPYLQR
jgi:hypothetical protein